MGNRVHHRACILFVWFKNKKSRGKDVMVPKKGSTNTKEGWSLLIEGSQSKGTLSTQAVCNVN